MATIQFLVDIFLHLDKHLSTFMQSYGVIAYILLFLVIFCETGLVVTPFLPGDSLIFAAGALAGIGIMGWPAVFIFIAAAVLGNMLNYQIGHFFSDKVKSRQNIRFIKREYIDRTEKFFEKYGGVTIIITRFMPLIRTFAPFVAGVGAMSYRRFFLYNAIGGVSWATFFFAIGFFFGNLPSVKDHFSLVVIAIVAISLIPAVVAFFKSRFSKKNEMGSAE